MDNNYLDVPDRASIEAYVDTLEAYRNNEEYQYSATYISTKNTNVMEVLDARTRLGVIENKEAIDELDKRLAALEVPSYRLIKDDTKYGDPIILNSELYSITGQVVYAKGKYVFPTTRSELYVVDEYDNIRNIGGTNPNIVCEGFEYEYGLFKHCQMAFANNKYYLYCPLNDSRPPYILVSDDLHIFHKMASIDDKITEINSNTNNNVSIIGSYFFNDGDTLILITPDSDILKYEGDDTKVWNYYGKAHIKDTETSVYVSPDISDRETMFIDYNNKKYCYIDHEGIYSTENYIEYTFEGLPDNSIKYFSKENNLLIVSGTNWAKYYNGTTWTDIILPPQEEEGVTNISNNNISCSQGIQIRYSNIDNKYWAIINKGSSDYSGIYSWNELLEAPTRHFSSLDNDDFVFTNDSDSTLKCVNGILYFISGNTNRLYTLKKGIPEPFSENPDYFKNLTKRSGGISALGYSAGYGASLANSTLHLVSVNGKLFGGGLGSTYGSSFIVPSLYRIVSVGTVNPDDSLMIFAK